MLTELEPSRMTAPDPLFLRSDPARLDPAGAVVLYSDRVSHVVPLTEHDQHEIRSPPGGASRLGIETRTARCP